VCFFFFSSRRRHTRSKRDWSSDVCSSDLGAQDRAGLGVAGDVEALGQAEIGDLDSRQRAAGSGQRRSRPFLLAACCLLPAARYRSEERRVGKECRGGGWRDTGEGTKESRN